MSPAQLIFPAINDFRTRTEPTDSMIVLLFSVFAQALSVPIDNGVVDEPEIVCGSSAISLTLRTRRAFEGRVYVRGHFEERDCRNDQIARSVVGIFLNLSTCGIQRSRSLDPSGVYASVTIVVTFHPLFLTKVDRVYNIQCFYMEASKTVDNFVQVSKFDSEPAEKTVPMPVCRYEILDGGPLGLSVRHVYIGQKVYHRWTCESETPEIFCLSVHSCFTEDGDGGRVQLVDADGCVSMELLKELQYTANALQAGTTTHVFKFAHRTIVQFTCQVTISVRNSEEHCPRPNCSRV